MSVFKIINRFQVHRGIFANCGVRTAACLHSPDSRLIERTLPDQELGVFHGVNVIGYDCKIDAVSEAAAKYIDERRLPGPYRTSDANPVRSLYVAGHRVLSCIFFAVKRGNGAE